MTALSKTGARRLADAEAKIEHGLTTFWEVGQALMQIRDERLYRAEFSTFEDYCQQRWDMSRRRANQLVEAAQLGTMVPTLTNERQARALAPLKEDPTEVREIFAEAEKRGDVTGAGIARVVAERKQTEAPTEPQFAAGGEAREGTAEGPPERVVEQAPPAALNPALKMQAALSAHRADVARWLAFDRHEQVIEAMTAEQRADYRSFVHSVWLHASNTLDALDNPTRLKAVQ